jgi:uncharacterized membrane protein
MIQFPPLPSWDGLHPLIIHFPIALLLVAPVLVVVAALRPKNTRGLQIAALILMLLGTAATFVAVATGEAAGKLAERTPEIKAVLESHEELAEATRVVFSVLTVLFAAIVFVPQLLRRDFGRITGMVLPLVFLVFYGAGALLLINTAHNGGRLVHEFGVRAMVAPTAAPNGATTQMPGQKHTDND